MPNYIEFEKNILLHYLNLEFRRLVGIDTFYSTQRAFELINKINFFALLFCKDYCVIPYSALVEDQLISNIFLKKKYDVFFENGLLIASLREDSPEEFIEKKIDQYSSHPELYEYADKNSLKRLKVHNIPIQRRDYEVGKAIYTNWKNELDDYSGSSIWKRVLTDKRHTSLAKKLFDIPTKIIEDRKGIIWPLVKEILNEPDKSINQRVREALLNLYFSNYVEDKRTVIITQLPFASDDFGLNYYKGMNYSFKLFSSLLSKLDIVNEFYNLTSYELVQLRETSEFYFFSEFYHSFFGEVEDLYVAKKLLNYFDSKIGLNKIKAAITQKKGLDKILFCLDLVNNSTNKIEFKMNNELPIVVILTAIKEEYLAVKEHLINLNDAEHNDTFYESGVFVLDGKEIANVIIRECGATNVVAAQETERAIQIFKPNCIMFVGIAGSRKPNDFTIGDVIFPTKVYSYEKGKAGKDTFSARPELANATFALVEKAKRERLNNDWKKLIKNDKSQNVKADLGVIASGEQLIEHYDSEIGRVITEHYNDTSAVEMEGFGFANAAIRQGRETNNLTIGVVRGISDIIEREKEDGINQSDRRPNDAKNLASQNAAAFAFWLIFKLFSKNNSVK